MERKQTLVYFDIDKLQRFDQFVVRPCSRSDLLNDVIDYLSQNPAVLSSFVQRRNQIMKSNAESNIILA